jgi:uncharacterized RDD family membrane protein YckC
MYDLQKASMWKRISAALCDLILVTIAVVGFALLFSTLFGYDTHTARLEEISETYEAEYGVDFDISEEDYAKLTDAEKAKSKAAMDAFTKDKEANYEYSVILNLTFLTVIFSVLLGVLLFELFVPLFLGNGQTLGKKVFAVAVMREDGVKLSPLILFVRTVLGKYTVETMIPVLIVLMIYMGIMDILGTIVLVGMLILQIILLASTKERSLLHDRLAHTVVVDFASQKIFETPEALLAYKQRIHAEEVEARRE